MTRYLLLALLALVTGCAQLPPPPEDSIAKRFEPKPGRAVIYLARHALEPTFVAPVVINGQMIGSTYRGTYMRIEVPAGRHVLRGMAGDSGGISIETAPDRIYYLEHRTYGYRTFVSSSFSLVDQERGQALVRSGQITALVEL
ncbi:MAG: hypothetical protein KIT13_01930 [Burkholderiales bacterium]|nr:hypothetical protein [Burkholderiales bacterium]